MPLSLAPLLAYSREASVALTDPTRLDALERFRTALMRVCGEEPTVSVSLSGSVHSPADLAELSLADHLDWGLKARHGAVYYIEEGSQHAPVCLAAFGRSTPALRNEGVLLPWLLEHGPLVRSDLTLSDLSLSEAERLIAELDELDASLVVPCPVNGCLRLVIVVGPPVVGRYEGTESLKLSLHGLAILRALARRQHGVPTRLEAAASQEARALRMLEELWRALKPAEPIRVMVVDEIPKTAERLATLFGAWGFDVTGVTTEAEACENVQRLQPHIVVVDLSLGRRLPRRFLEMIRTAAPDTRLLGTTTGYGETDLSSASVRAEIGRAHV